MFRQVLVPVSFSACDRHLARYACSAARAIGGAVTFLHVLEPPTQGSVPSETQQRVAQQKAAQQDAAHAAAAQELLAQLSLLARRPPTCLIVPVASSSPEMSVASTILRVAAEIGADLIMMGLQEQERPPVRTAQAVFPQVSCGHVLWQVLLESRVPLQVVPCLHGEPLPAPGWRGTFAARL